jgi:hypothetical protein
MTCALLGSLVGLLVSYLLSPQYRARAALVEILPSQYDPRGPVDESASQQRLTTYLEQAFSLYLRKTIEREGIATAEEVERVYRQIRRNTKLEDAVLNPQVPSELSVDLVYTDSTPQRAEQLCSVLTSAIWEKTRFDGAWSHGLGQSPVPTALRWSCHVMRQGLLFPPIDFSALRSDQRLVCWSGSF